MKAALNSVLLSAGMAAGLTALVIILFLGNVRLSLIILAAIPLVDHHRRAVHRSRPDKRLNTMTLGGFALAIGILVDNGTVVIENIERHVAMREPLHQSIVVGASEVAVPTFLVDPVHLHRVRAGISCCKARRNICSRRCRSR